MRLQFSCSYAIFCSMFSTEVRVALMKPKLPYMASTACCDLLYIAVELTNSSAAQNHVVFQRLSGQAKYGTSGILTRNRKAFAVFF